MKKLNPIALPQVSPGCFAVTSEQAAALFSPAELSAGEKRLTVKSVGEWHVPVSATGLAVSFDHDADRADYYANPQPLIVYGERTMTNWKQLGYEAEGKVSIGGKRVRAFTSSKLFQLPDGQLLSCGVLHLGK